ncbi:MAG: zinc ribbon domain-containing protein [Chloroflexota bacterium]|nr:zinc ribbon domain-containing protein [Chloroflexota bacterium]
MPQYDFRCDSCGRSFSLSFKTYAAYDAAEPRCAVCGAGEVSRVINRVSIAKVERNYSGMSANEMLSVLEGGDEKQVDAMFRQVGESAPATPPTVVPKQTDKGNNGSPDTGKSTSTDDS